MSKKDYEKAARIAQEQCIIGKTDKLVHASVVRAFVDLFRDDNSRFNEDRFRRACAPGANVKSRKAVQS